jgi:hypothetical protein
MQSAFSLRLSLLRRRIGQADFENDYIDETFLKMQTSQTSPTVVDLTYPTTCHLLRPM